MADAPMPGSRSPKGFNGKPSGKRTPPKKSGYSPKGTDSPRSLTRGGSDSSVNQGSHPVPSVSPLRPRDEPDKAGRRSPGKGANSPVEHGASPLNLAREQPPRKPGAKMATRLGASSSKRKTTSGRISPKPEGSPKRKPSPVRGGSASKPSGSLRTPDEPETHPGEPSPKSGGYSIVGGLERSPGSAKLGTSANSGSSLLPERSPKVIGGVPAGRVLPAGKSSSERGRSPTGESSSPRRASSAGGRSPVRGGMPLDSGGALGTDDNAAKAELNASSPRAEPGSEQPGESKGRPTISMKDPRYRYFVRALMADRGRRRSGSPGSSGRASPSPRSPGASVYASDNDAAVYERGTSNDRLTTEARGHKRRSGTSSPASPQR